MGVLQRFERRLQGLVDGTFAKVFKADVQPVEIGAALQRECDDHAAIMARGRTLVPNDFVVELGPADHERLAPLADALREELIELVTDHAREQRYAFLGPVHVSFERADDLETGVFRVQSSSVAAVSGAVPVPAATGAARGVPGAQQGPRLEIGDGVFPLTRDHTVLGRGSEADIRINDPGVSRRHAEVVLGADQSVSVVDLGSTNGTYVDGQRVTRSPLYDGAVLRVGATEVRVRTGGDTGARTGGR